MPTAAEMARNSRREMVLRDMMGKFSLHSGAAVCFLFLDFIDLASLQFKSEAAFLSLFFTGVSLLFSLTGR
jgi:hypothetical protein